MPNASGSQSNFHGGEWSPFSQGRIDHPEYRTGMQTCLNGLPLEEGAWTRRPGFRRLDWAYKGGKSVLREFHFVNSAPYALEFSAGMLRMFWGGGLVLTNQLFQVQSISGANPAVVRTAGNHGYTTGDEVVFLAPDGVQPTGAGHILRRALEIVVTGADTFTLLDPATRAVIDGATLTANGAFLSVAKVFHQVTPYSTTELDGLRVLQDDVNVYVFHGSHNPKLLQAVVKPTGCSYAEFTYTDFPFVDGPYLDPYPSAPTASASALSGSVTITLASGAYPFVATDVGRQMRFLNEPPDWDNSTPWPFGANVKYAGLYWTNEKGSASTGEQPDITPTSWVADPKALVWTYGTITAVTDATHATVRIDGPAMRWATAMSTWRMGLYSNTTGWPTGGIFHEGRLWLWGNVIPHRIDGSMSGAQTLFSPTDQYGQVSDNNAVGAEFQSDDVNPIFWARTDEQGIILGTQSKEYLIRSSAAGEIITPTSIQARPVSVYGSSNAPALRIGPAVLFTGRFNRKVWEYGTDQSANVARYTAVNVTLRSKHLSAPGLSELAYQAELNPVLWARTAQNGLIGCSYKRDGTYSEQQNNYLGWHRHTLGNVGQVESIQAGPLANGTDTVWASVLDPITGFREIQQLSLIYGQNADPTTACFVDSAVVPTAAEKVNVGGVDKMRYYGLDHLNGRTVSAWVCGLDAGDYLISGGILDIPIDGSIPGLTTAKFSAVTALSSDFQGLGLTISAGASANTPAAANFGSVTEYIPTGAIGISSGVVNWVNNRLYSIDSGSSSADGIRVFNLTTAAQVAVSTADVIMAGAPGSGTISDEIDADDLGFLYCPDGGGSNAEYLYKINGNTLQYVTACGKTSGNLTPGVDGVLHGPTKVKTVAGRTAVFVANNAGVGSYIQAFDGDAFVPDSMSAYLGALACDNKVTTLVKGGSRTAGCSQWGEVWGMSNPGSTWAVYRCSATSDGRALTVSMAKVGTILPTAIQADWTAVTGTEVDGLVYDETDGNLIVCLRNAQGGVAHEFVIAKISSSDLSVMWVTPGFFSSKQSRVIDSKLVYHKDNSVITIDTTTGVISAQALVGVTGSSEYDGYTGIVIQAGNYTSGGGAPVSTNSGDFVNQWYRFGYAPRVASSNTYFAPAVFGFNYTSQGATLSPMLPNEVGTPIGIALGKTRRAHMFAVYLQRSGPIKVGSELSGTLRPVKFQNPDGTPYAFGTLFNGVVQDTFEDNYDFRGQFAWQYDRPVPGTVLAVETFIQGQER